MNSGAESMESIFVGIGAGGIFPVSVGRSCDGLLCCSVVFVLLFLMVLGVVIVGRKIVTLCISLVVTNIIRGVMEFGGNKVLFRGRGVTMVILAEVVAELSVCSCLEVRVTLGRSEQIV